MATARWIASFERSGACTGRDHVASGEVDEIDRVEDGAHGFDFNVLGVAPLGRHRAVAFR